MCMHSKSQLFNSLILDIALLVKTLLTSERMGSVGCPSNHSCAVPKCKGYVIPYSSLTTSHRGGVSSSIYQTTLEVPFSTPVHQGMGRKKKKKRKNGKGMERKENMKERTADVGKEQFVLSDLQLDCSIFCWRKAAEEGTLYPDSILWCLI